MAILRRYPKVQRRSGTRAPRDKLVPIVDDRLRRPFGNGLVREAQLGAIARKKAELHEFGVLRRDCNSDVIVQLNWELRKNIIRARSNQSDCANH
jgi:hypothetical protein